MSELSLEVSCQQVKDRLDAGADFLLLDCREADEHETARVEKSLLLPMSEIAQRQEELQGKEDAEIVVYCHHGMRSARVTAWLREQGFAKAQSMAGGIDQWSVEIDAQVPRY